MMGAKIKVLDHGFVSLVETWGSDERIIEAARESTDKGFLGWGPKCSRCGEVEIIYTGENPPYPRACPKTDGPHDLTVSGDEKLLRHLWVNKHSTPFEFAGAVIRIQAPIFVFREHHRHRTQSYSEISARYTPLPDLNYVPTVERLLLNSKTNKQAGTIAGADEMTEKHALEYQECLRQHYRTDQEMYDYTLRAGVPKELARVHLPVGRYSRMRASANLRNWLQFLTLRCAESAQFEIRQYANVVRDILTEKFPRTLALWSENR